MKRLLVVVACFALAAPLWAEKPRSRRASAPLAYSTINGSPLRVVIGDDTSMQVYNSNVPGLGQFYDPDSEPTEAGVSAFINGVTYGPDDTSWTPVSMSPITGTGTAADPYTLVVVCDAGTTGLRLTETVTYINGQPQFNAALAFSNTGNATVNFNAFIGADLYLADNDAGFSVLQGTSAGGRGASDTCTQLQYVILFVATTPADRWTGTYYGDVWDQITAGTLNNQIDSAICQDNGAAIEWENRTLAPGASLTINTGVSFTGQAVPLGATVPALSPKAMAALVLLLAAVGYVLARKSSLGA
jgi:hypothetical protein